MQCCRTCGWLCPQCIPVHSQETAGSDHELSTVQFVGSVTPRRIIEQPEQINNSAEDSAAAFIIVQPMSAGQVRMKLCRDMFSDLMTPHVLNEVIPVIAVVGRTGAGKSMLTTTLAINSPHLPAVREGLCAPTTADISCYLGEGGADIGQMRLPFKSLLLDFEGTFAAYQPAGLNLDNIVESIRDKVKTLRKNVVDSLFPSLACVISDVVVFVTKASFSDDAFQEDLLNFIENSEDYATTRGWRPALVVIQTHVPSNMFPDYKTKWRTGDLQFDCTEKMARDVNYSTFISKLSVSSQFANVTFLLMPMFDVTEIHPGRMNAWIRQLEQTLYLNAKYVHHLRWRRNCLYTASRWRDLCEGVIDDFNAKGMNGDEINKEYHFPSFYELDSGRYRDRSVAFDKALGCAKVPASGDPQAEFTMRIAEYLKRWAYVTGGIYRRSGYTADNFPQTDLRDMQLIVIDKCEEYRRLVSLGAPPSMLTTLFQLTWFHTAVARRSLSERFCISVSCSAAGTYATRPTSWSAAITGCS